MKSVAIAIGLCLLAGGCASVIKGSTQSIAISTPPTTGATCELSSGQGNWMVVSPGVATVDKSKEDIQARCTKPGWGDAVATIPSNFEGWTVGNILLGGVIGLGVDAATGAINDYPHTFQIPMTPLYGGVPAAPPVVYAGSFPYTASVPTGAVPPVSSPAATYLPPSAPLDYPAGATGQNESWSR